MSPKEEKGRLFSFRCLFIKLSCLLFLFALPLLVYGQNYVCKSFAALDTIRIDSLPVEQGSLSLTPEVAYRFDAESNLLILQEAAHQDSIKVCYRTISSQLYQPFYSRDIRTYSHDGGSSPADHQAVRYPALQEEELFDFGKIESYGAITRGVTFGNRQNLFVNSSLNLQMTGDLSDDLKVSAVITDQNIPYQPEGNTQQIRDFDNVFIKLYNSKFEVVAGDIVLQNPVDDQYFLKYYKNVQGLSLNYRYGLNEKWKARSMVTGSLAKGQFTSAVIDPIEGVQGPYKLRGPNGERFIIVLANSERVYLDGVLLQRGFDRDYVIDYNLGEITFGNDVVITRFSRIRIDYEYSDQYYARSSMTAIQEIKSKQTSFYFNYYREKDNPSGTLGFDLAEADLENLRAAGDNQRLAVISGVDSVGFNEHGILYEKVDTVDASGAAHEVYVYSTDSRQALYQLSFSEVGAGYGHYVLSSSVANGRIFEWVPPVNGQPQGNYAPVRVIPTPNQKQMMVIGATHELTDYERVYQETAISGVDRNLYSPLDDENNSGIAWKGGIRSQGRSVDFLTGYKLNAALSFEFNHRDFSAIDRFRSVDYDRDWSYNVFADTINRQDQILNASVGLTKNARNTIHYDFSFRNRSEVIEGTQHQLDVVQEIGPFLVSSQNFYLQNQPGALQSQWLRSTQMIRFNQWKIQPGYQLSIDQNTTSMAETDSITGTWMHFKAHNFFVETADTSRGQVRLDYIRRKDQLPVMGDMQSYTEADEFRLGTSLSLFHSHKIGAQVNYRTVKELMDNEKTEDNILGRLNWSGSFLDNLIRHNLTYTTANSRELKRAFIYVNVPTGEGTHTWRDENGDDIRDINEFYEAVNQDEKNYIKLFTPTDEYINAYQTSYLHTLDMGFPSQWKGRGGLRSFLSRLTFNTNLKYHFKTTSNALQNRLNPLGQELDDPELLSSRNLNRATLFYNRNARGPAFDIARTSQVRKSLLSNGFELDEKEDWVCTARVNVNMFFTVRAKAGLGTTVNSSDFLLNRNFNLNRNLIMTELVWQPATVFRVITAYERRERVTFDSEVPGASSVNEFRVESTWVRSAKGNLNATFHWLNIDYSGPDNTYLSYELLEALQPGSNQRWNVNWQQSMGKGLQLSLQYNGRKSSGNNAIHTGTMQVTAFF